MHHKQIKLDIIIVNYNSGNMLQNCLKSISDAEKSSFILNKIIIIDNNSSDKSIEKIDNSFNLPIQIIKNNNNVGFAKACNLGAKHTNSKYILFLNPDIILMKNSLEEPIKFLEKDENTIFGVVGIQLLDFNNKITRTCCRFPKFNHFINKIFGLNKLSSQVFKTYFMQDWSHNENKVVDHVIGAFYLIRRDLFFKLGGFDERFFLYMEDLDLSYRLYKEGYFIYYLTNAKAFHKGGGTTENIKSIRLYYSLESRIIFCYKHFNIFTATLILILTFFIEPIIRLLYLIISLNFNDIKNLFINYYLLWKNLIFIIKKSTIRNENFDAK